MRYAQDTPSPLGLSPIHRPGFARPKSTAPPLPGRPPQGRKKRERASQARAEFGTDPFSIHMTAHSARPAAKTAMAAAIMFMVATRFDSRIGAAS